MFDWINSRDFIKTIDAGMSKTCNSGAIRCISTAMSSCFWMARIAVPTQATLK